MGCDIHGIAEVQYAFDRWIEVENMPDDRNYPLFAALADVRNNLYVIRDGEPAYIESLVPRRGFPGGCSAILAFVNSDNHSFSWTTPEEVLSWEGWDQKLRDGLKLREICSEFLIWCERLQKEHSDKNCRIVFWFDN